MRSLFSFTKMSHIQYALDRALCKPCPKTKAQVGKLPKVNKVCFCFPFPFLPFLSTSPPPPISTLPPSPTSRPPSAPHTVGFGAPFAPRIFRNDALPPICGFGPREAPVDGRPGNTASFSFGGGAAFPLAFGPGTLRITGGAAATLAAEADHGVLCCACRNAGAWEEDDNGGNLAA